MIAARLLERATERAWNAYVLSHPDTHFAQRTEWLHLITEFFPVSSRWWLAQDETDRIVGVLPAFRGRSTLFTPPGGLVADSPEVAATLLDQARADVERGGLRWLELRDQAKEWPGLLDNPEHVTLVLDLAGDEDAQWRSFPAKVRNQVRKAERSGLRCVRGHDQVEAFHRVFSENMRDLGTPAMERAFFRRALELYGEAAEILVVHGEGRPIGAMFTIRHGQTVHDPWASSLRRHFELCPNNLLYWEALRQAIASGARRFDFGRSQPGSGTYHFKAQYGARPVPLHYQYVMGTATRIPTLADQKASLDVASRLWRRVPLPVARLLGPRARRFFPEAL